MLRRLCVTDAGARLPGAVQEAASQLAEACGPRGGGVAAAHRRLAAALQELHGAIVTADHALGEERAPLAAGASPASRAGACLCLCASSHVCVCVRACRGHCL